MALENSAEIVEKIQDIDVDPLATEGVRIQAQGANGVRIQAQDAEGVRNQAQGLMLYRVPEHVRRGRNHIYEPQVVPLGPYHHREHPERELVEPLKNELRVKFCGDRESSLLRQIHERIGEIRHFYGGADGYTDKELAEMMLRDACFLIGYMHGGDCFPLISQRLGMMRSLLMYGDMRMLENQIPFWLISLIHPHPRSFLCNYMNLIVFGDSRPGQANGGEEPIVAFGGYERITQLPWENGRGEEPLHLLEASRQTLLSLAGNQENWVVKQSSVTVWQMVNSPFRSVTDLKAKGIRFRQSSHCLTDIKFSSFAFYAELQLPSFYLTKKANVYYSNIIAFEMSPERHTNYAVTTYFNFMKALIHNANDVKVLREKGILFGSLTSDDEVVEMFKSIETYGCSNRRHGLFRDVKMRIDEHCNSKARTWMADLMKTNFRSPWTVIALGFAALLLCLTFLQTFYTINPHN